MGFIQSLQFLKDSAPFLVSARLLCRVTFSLGRLLHAGKVVVTVPGLILVTVGESLSFLDLLNKPPHMSLHCLPSAGQLPGLGKAGGWLASALI